MFNNGSNGYSLSDIAAVTRGSGMGGNYNFGGSGGFGGGYGGDGAWWLIVLFLFAFAGFGGNGWGGFGGGNNGGGFNTFPWLLTAENNTDNLVTAGFNQAAVQSSLSGIQSAVTSGFGDTALGIAGINQNICQTGNGITAAVTNGFAQSEIADNARQMANMQQAFNSQVATTAAINGLQSSMDSCLNAVGTLVA